VLDQLKAGADFDQLAARNDPATRGELGWFPRGYLLDTKIEDAAFALQPGQYSDIISTEVGFDIIKVLERDPQHPLTPDAYLAMQEKALTDWLQQQRQNSKIVIQP
jgi:peptidyl-prolyl cis-trans isomerase C